MFVYTTEKRKSWYLLSISSYYTLKWTVLAKIDSSQPPSSWDNAIRNIWPLYQGRDRPNVVQKVKFVRKEIHSQADLWYRYVIPSRVCLRCISCFDYRPFHLWDYICPTDQFNLDGREDIIVFQTGISDLSHLSYFLRLCVWVCWQDMQSIVLANNGVYYDMKVEFACLHMSLAPSSWVAWLHGINEILARLSCRMSL